MIDGSRRGHFSPAEMAEVFASAGIEPSQKNKAPDNLDDCREVSPKQVAEVLRMAEQGHNDTDNESVS